MNLAIKCANHLLFYVLAMFNNEMLRITHYCIVTAIQKLLLVVNLDTAFGRGILDVEMLRLFGSTISSQLFKKIISKIL